MRTSGYSCRANGRSYLIMRDVQTQDNQTLQAETEENKELEKNIVQSPERLLREIGTFKENIDETSKKLTDTE